MDSDERVNKPVCLIELRKLKSISQQLKEIRSNWKKKKSKLCLGRKEFSTELGSQAFITCTLWYVFGCCA